MKIYNLHNISGLGYDFDLTEAYEQGKAAGKDAGAIDGAHDGYENGYHDGYDDGLEECQNNNAPAA